VKIVSATSSSWIADHTVAVGLVEEPVELAQHRRVAPRPDQQTDAFVAERAQVPVGGGRGPPIVGRHRRDVRIRYRRR
jgi:hypothetical protein